jgi:hypothetical protein
MRTSSLYIALKSQSCLTTESQSSSLSWCQATLRAHDQFSFSLKCSLNSCEFIILWRPLWREDMSLIYCCCLASSVQSLSSLCPTGLKTIFYCPNFWDFSNLKDQSPYLYPQGQGGPVILWALGSISVSSYDSQGYGGGIVTRHLKVEVTLRLTVSQSVNQSVSQYVLISSTLVGLMTRYYFLSECCLFSLIAV